jgi:ubiquinone/menaquinone biosynthesis C-methylase UbiE
MKSNPSIALSDVQTVYGGAEGQLWELIMGQQIHIGGLRSSMDLAAKAAVGPGMTGVDLCCCSGAGMRFLVRFCQVERMIGVDATETVIRSGRCRNEAEGLAARIDFVLGDVCQSGLPDAAADFVWGEDAWCYVVDKPRLVAEAARLVKPGGTIAMTDWVEGPAGLSDAEAARYLRFMKFPNVLSMAEYCGLLSEQKCEIVVAENTGRFAPCVDLYLNMLDMQLTYDALKIIGFDQSLMQAMAGEMRFLQELAHAGKIAQGLLVARKPRAA